MEDNFDYKEYLKNNPLLNENQILTEEQKIDKAKQFLSTWKEKYKEFNGVVDNLINAYNKKHGK